MSVYGVMLRWRRSTQQYGVPFALEIRMSKPFTERRRKENQELRELIDLTRAAHRIANEQGRELEEVTRELLFQKLGRNDPIDSSEGAENAIPQEPPESHLRLT